ncbi:DUF971 domain-containing protein [Coralliovum pocilloporae]|uniref:DUF971 domain-containing protein n=1 Tax=Coralliovum pocilloporae TaxID=3066369 RepID=UPI003307BA84
MSAQSPQPTELRVSQDKRCLTVSFDNNERFELSAEYLRVESPSAEVQGHGADQKQIVSGKKHVSISNIEPVGNYAVRITFSDGHNTGYYMWETFLALGREREQIWQTYIDALDARGLSR